MKYLNSILAVLLLTVVSKEIMAQSSTKVLQAVDRQEVSSKIDLLLKSEPKSLCIKPQDDGTYHLEFESTIAEQMHYKNSPGNEGRVLLVVEYGYPDGYKDAQKALANACTDGILKQSQCRIVGKGVGGGYTACSGLCYSN